MDWRAAESHLLPVSFKEDLKQRVPLSSLIAPSVQWDRRKTRPAKHDFWAPCPFHAEDTASFHVDDDKGFYHCFGCKASGDHFTWAKEKLGLPFREAAEMLAAEVGMALPQLTPEQQQREKRRASLYEVCEAAARYFEAALDSPAGEAARAYLDGRGIDEAMRRRFRIGLADGQRSSMFEALSKLGFDQDHLVEAGLVREGVGSNPPSNRFFGRIMLPIDDVRGRAVGFSGRMIAEGDGPKYLNSPESPLFDKGNLLYNLPRAREASSSTHKIIAVEGYMDVIALARAGIDHAVATMGTAVTEQQLKLLWRQADEPIFCFDSDDAGRKARSRTAMAALPLLKPGLSLKFATLPDAKDADEFLSKNGPKALAAAFASPQGLADALWQDLVPQADTTTPERRAKFQQIVVDMVALIADASVRKQYESFFAEKLRAFWREKGIKPSPVKFEKTTKSARPRSHEGKGGGDDGDASDRKQRAAGGIIGLAEAEGLDLFMDSSGDPYATIKVASHEENWSISSREFKRWLRGLYYRKTGAALGRTALEDALGVFEARAVEQGKKFATYRRIGRHGDAIYVDLGDDVWRAVELSQTGWRIAQKAECKFIRSAATRELPAPQKGGSLEDISSFVNFASDADRVGFIGWLVACMRPGGPFPILVLISEQGSGKSFTSRLANSLVDPNASPLRAIPDNERDLFIAARNRHLSAFDNTSGVSDQISDALCRGASGGAYSTRTLHSDLDETLIEVCRPFLLNGLTEITRRPDLASRAVRVTLKPIAEHERKPESVLLAELEQALPKLFGALLDATVSALTFENVVKLDRLPRMADAVRWVTAAEQALGWFPETFLKAFEASSAEMSAINADDDPMVIALEKLFDKRGGEPFEGSMTELLAALNDVAGEKVLKNFRWPSTPTKLGDRVRRQAETLRKKGYQVTHYRSGARKIHISLQQLSSENEAR